MNLPLLRRAALGLALALIPGAAQAGFSLIPPPDVRYGGDEDVNAGAVKALNGGFAAAKASMDGSHQGRIVLGFTLDAKGKVSLYHVINLSSADPVVKDFCVKALLSARFQAPPKGFYDVPLAFCDFFGKDGSKSYNAANPADPKTIGQEFSYVSVKDAPAAYVADLESALNSRWFYPKEASSNGIQGTVRKKIVVSGGEINQVLDDGPKADPILENTFAQMWVDGFGNHLGLRPDVHVEGGAKPSFTASFSVEWKLNR